MKRSEINAALRWAEKRLREANISLPPFARWDCATWRENQVRTQVMREVMLGWDITDFGMGDFARVGAVLYTLRNGVVGRPGFGAPYAEKYIVLAEGQRLPCHYHAVKTEDIINRCGGQMAMRLYNRKPDGGVDESSDVTVFLDDMPRTVHAGEEFLIAPGSSVRLTPYMYHIFGAKEGYGPLVAGEVSSINDDNTDNYFSEPVKRFADIEEDEPIYRPLCGEYEALLL